MAQQKGRLAKPPAVDIRNVTFDIDEATGSLPWSGSFELPVGNAVQPGETYHIELADGRTGDIRVTGYNEITTRGIFEGVSPLT